MAPAPRTRVPKGEIVTETPRRLSGANGAENGGSDSRKASLLDVSSSPQVSSFMVRRRSSGNNGSLSVPVENADFLQHLKHLGPSNVASRPKSTRINTVKIKQAIPTTIHEDTLKPRSGSEIVPPGAPQGGIGEGLLDNAGREARDGVHSLAVGYGTMTDTSADHKPWRVGGAEQKTQDDKPSSPKSAAADETTKLMEANGSPHLQRSNSRSTVGSLLSRPSGADSPKRRNTARSGSISQNIVDMNGVRKMVLETASSSDSEDKAFAAAQVDGALDQKPNSDQEDMNNSQTSSKKKRKKRGKKKKGGNGDGSESQPLLGEE
jgi:metal transporter CNNM